jgi:hypothetical protein
MPHSCLITSILLSVFVPPAAAQLEFERDPINYSKTPATDSVAKFIKRMDDKQVELKWDDRHGYLTSFLQQLDIPQSSQTLVFSKTSFQRQHISPRTPRAVYFNDDVYVGWVRGGKVIEISAADPNLGAVFYRLEQSDQGTRPKLVRENDDCLSCHASTHTRRIPGHIMRSVYPEASGLPRFSAGTFRTSHTSRFRQRFGGWYVTGTHGNQRHMGNQTHTEGDGGLDLDLGANVTDISEKVAIQSYLTPHSDIVALMVLGHQVSVHNAITAANFNTRRALRDGVVMNKALDRDLNFESDSTRRRIASAAESLVEALLFVDEIGLTSPVAGTSTFAEDFQRRGPHDKSGRSLREFDLKTRMFRYPCSFLIYSEAFDALPQRLLVDVYRSINNVLTGGGDAAKFAHLSPGDRDAIREILTETKPLWKSLQP